jgi:hypothetical protein
MSVRLADGSDFAVDIGSLHACVVHPAALRDPATCRGFAPDAVATPQDNAHKKTIGVAIVPLSSDTTGVLNVALVPGTPPEPRSDDDARRLMHGAAEGMRPLLPSNAVVRETGATLVRLGSGDAAIRGDVDVENLPESLALLEHSAFLVVQTTKGGYAITISGPRTARAEIDASVDSLILSTTAASPARGGGHDYGYEVGQLIGQVFFFAVIGVVLYFVYRRGKKKQEQQWPEQQWQHQQRPPPS